MNFHTKELKNGSKGSTSFRADCGTAAIHRQLPHGKQKGGSGMKLILAAILSAQLFNFIPRYRFEKIVKKSGEDRYCKHFTAWKQFLTLLFAQISGKDSLREIENALLARCKQFYHSGMEAVAKSTLEETMNRLDPEIFEKKTEWLLQFYFAVIYYKYNML